jgi:hypothetical protein
MVVTVICVKIMENDENRRSVIELTFETDVEDTPLDSDSDISLNLTSESSSENDMTFIENATNITYIFFLLAKINDILHVK